MNDATPFQKDIIEKVKLHVQLVKKQYECPICIDFFEHPVVTNCQHAFCKKCIESFIGNKRSQNCPMCKKNINMRSLSNSPALENWVQKAKQLSDAYDSDLGIEYKPSHNSMLYENEMKRRSTDDENVSLNKPKRKRSRSFEKNTAKKKKSVEPGSSSSTNTPTTSTSSSNKKQPRKKKAAANKENLPPPTNQENNHDIGKVHEWLNNKENPFEANNTTGINYQPGVNVCVAPPAHNRINSVLAPTNSVLTSEGTSSGIYSEEPEIDSIRTESMETKPDLILLDPNEIQVNVVSLITNFTSLKDPLKFRRTKNIGNVTENFTSRLRSDRYKITPRLINSTSRLLKNLKISTDSDLANRAANNNDVSIIFQEQANHQKQKEPIQKKVDKILLKERKPIQFFYRGTVKKLEKKSQQSTLNSSIDSTNKRYNDAGTQTELLNQVFEMDSFLETIESNLVEILFKEIESSLINEVINVSLNNLDEAKNEVSSLQVISETPPMQNNLANIVKDISTKITAPIVTVIPDTCVIPDTNVNIVITDTCQMNFEEPSSSRVIPKMKCPIPNPHQFSELVGHSRPLNSVEKKSKKLLFKRDRLPTLDFHDKSSSDDQPATPGKLSAIDPKKRFLFDTQKLVINDTPQKSDDLSLKNFKELNDTLSKSANRVEFDPRFLENSSLRYEGSFVVTNDITNNRTNYNESKNPEMTMPYEHNDIEETNLDEPDINRTDFSKTNIDNTGVNDTTSNDTTSNVTTDVAVKSVIADSVVSSKTDTISSIVAGKTVKQNKGLVGSAAEEGSVKKEEKFDPTDENMTVNREPDVIDLDETNYDGPLPPREETVEDNQGTFQSSKNAKKNVNSEPKDEMITQPISNQSKPIRNTPKPPPQMNNSINFDSMDITTNQSGMVPPNISMIQTFNDVNQSSRRSDVNNLPPPAADILGDSINPTNSTFLGDITNKRKSQGPTQNLAQNEIVSTKPIEEAPRKSENIFKVPSVISSKMPDSAETALLTDSELLVIDNLCKDMYSVHNQTIDGSTSGNLLDMTTVSSLLSKRHDRIEFVCSLLKPDKKDMVKRFARFIKATVTDDVSDTTTHLVVESDKNFICGVTSKYLKAISRKIWIVSIIWILSSVNQNKLLDPVDFEIKGDGIFGMHNGPRLSRLSTTDLFDNYEFLFIGKFETDSINLKEMVKLASKNGANVVRKAKDFSDNKIRTVLFDEKLQRISVKNANFMLESAKIFSVTTSWLLDSLACYCIRDMKLYALYKDD